MTTDFEIPETHDIKQTASRYDLRDYDPCVATRVEDGLYVAQIGSASVAFTSVERHDYGLILRFNNDDAAVLRHWEDALEGDLPGDGE
ncbi:hypothetical protein C475_08957 [Halosimplex carlsbadense 2-9-1]|uniref:Uncharacterized protein n=1 Tax=Halosimplex carlsbadense 2-9-1 TaxID=797114 RepID=M0CVB5_9EURY|nr:hypothetical protein [Halosimplex carlsbadense]ELZ26543.1 hypothetical protein C475_08957 [Halosimplex carlsbadense 2-9-1]